MPLPPERDQSALERAQERLYSPAAPIEPFSVPTLTHEDTAQLPAWAPEPVPTRRPLPLATKFLIGAGGFAVLAGLTAAGIIIFGARAVSTEHITLSIDAPPTIASGDTVPISLTVANGNPSTITNTSITATFPGSARSVTASSTPLPPFVDTLGDLAPGASATRTITGIFYGGENETITVPVRFEYKMGGSNTTFVTQKDYTFTVTSSPVTLEVTSMKQTTSGAPITLAVSVRSNTANTLPNLAIAAGSGNTPYPAGFTVTKTDPAGPSTSFFEIGDLAPGQEKHVTVTGTLSGTSGQQKDFTFSVGTTKGTGIGALDTTFTSDDSLVTLGQPFIGTTLAFAGQSGDNTVVSPGQVVTGTLVWVNQIATAINHAQISVQFSGSALDASSVRSSNGYYRSSDSTLIFSQDTNQDLAALASGNTGTGTFTLNVLPAARLASIHNPSITATVTVAGTPDGAGAQQVMTLTKTLQVASSASLSASMTHTGGPFPNTGPVPPTPNQETQYTITFTARNAVNTLANTAVTATLPSYVRFTGQTAPSDGSVSYNDASHMVTWRPGDLTSGSTESASFQVAVLPSVSQEGTSPTVASNLSLTGTDRFTQTKVTAEASDLTTIIRDDPRYQLDWGVVR